MENKVNKVDYVCELIATEIVLLAQNKVIIRLSGLRLIQYLIYKVYH